MGGGTTDLSVVHIDNGVFSVRATGGHSALGGNNIDAALLDLLLEKTRALPGEVLYCKLGSGSLSWVMWIWFFSFASELHLSTVLQAYSHYCNCTYNHRATAGGEGSKAAPRATSAPLQAVEGKLFCCCCSGTPSYPNCRNVSRRKLFQLRKRQPSLSLCKALLSLTAVLKSRPRLLEVLIRRLPSPRWTS
jgi:hypothetical protein